MSVGLNHDVCIVDDDPDIIRSLTMLLETSGCNVTSFLSGIEFMNSDVGGFSGCVLLDVRMPTKDGLTILKEALQVNPNLQVVMMSGHGDIPMAVKAIGLGAKNFIEKPFKATVILNALQAACESKDLVEKDVEFAARARKLLALLTPRELEVAKRMADGMPNKIIAFELGISIRTVETHRAHVLSKLQAKSLAEIVKLYLAATDPKS